MAFPGTLLPLKRILCPVDFSEPSYTALAAGRELSVYFSSELTLLHVLHPLSDPIGEVPTAAVEPHEAYEREEVEREALSALNEVADEHALIRDRLSLFVLHGEPADAIVRFAREQETDLIVIATHGRTGWRRSVFGSVAERVVRLARCPVLTIRDTTEW